MKRTVSRLLTVSAAAVLAACGGGGGSEDGTRQSLAAQPSTSSQLARLGIERVPQAASVSPAAVKARIDRRLEGRSGQVDVWVQLDQRSLASTRATLASTLGIPRVRSADRKATDAPQVRQAMQSQRAAIRAQQDGVASRLASLGARELGRAKVAHNAIAVRVPANQIAAIAAMDGVVRVRPVVNYQLDLSETVPYIGGTAVQNLGVDGTGVKVAVLDSGIDYTHKNLGGGGTLADYQAAYGTSPADPKNTTRDGLFPTAKVVDGYDFVGEVWPNGPEVPDPDPIDLEGHGTHVADIIAGKSNDGTHKGVAPGASLYAVKVCSAVSSSCSGIALLQGMDFALDPNGDGDLSDAADVINMSLGSSYGQIEDDLTLATSNAVDLGVVVVASAGNSADRPFITGSPSIAAGAIGVAQTQVPSALAYPLVVTGITPSTIANTATVEWAPIGAGFSGEVVRLGRGCPADSISAGSPADPYFNGNSPSGKVALIDRGSCSISLKVDRATKAGAIAVLIANNAAGDPPSFSFGGGDLPLAPTIVITQSDGNRIKSALGSTGVNPAVVASVSPNVTVPLVGSMVASSSRGPSYSLRTIKPEIGAPGASISAIAGSGDGTEAFGGTSGAAPMVAGAAALLLQAHPSRPPMAIKAMLMNSAETAIYTNPATQPGVLAPITRIGAGEVRVDRALAMDTVAWDKSSLSASLSFGFVDADGREVIRRTLTVQNLGKTGKRYSISPSFRYADDQASGAVEVRAPGSVFVPPGGSADVQVTLIVDGTKLPDWPFNGGSTLGNGALQNLAEFDGYLTLTNGDERLSVPWQVMPRKSSAMAALVASGKLDRDFTLVNRSANGGEYDIFSLTGRSAQLPGPLPGPGSNQAVIDIRSVGVRYLPASLTGAGDYLEFAISTYGRRSHPNYPAEFDIYIDSNNDGTDDFVVYNLENGTFASSGQNVVAIANLATGAGAIYFFADADLVSGNMIFTVPMNASTGLPINLGLAPGSTMRFAVLAFDNYFTGTLTDIVEGMAFTPGSERFNSGLFGGIAGNASAQVPFTRGTVPAANSTEQGLLLMYRRNANRESQEVLLGGGL